MVGEPRSCVTSPATCCYLLAVAPGALDPTRPRPLPLEKKNPGPAVWLGGTWPANAHGYRYCEPTYLPPSAAPRAPALAAPTACSPLHVGTR